MRLIRYLRECWRLSPFATVMMCAYGGMALIGAALMLLAIVTWIAA